MTRRRFVSVGECMIEMSGGENNRYRMGFAGDTLNTAWYARANLGQDWQVSYFTALGADLYSVQMRAFLDDHGIETGQIRVVKDRRPGLYLIHQQDGDRHFTYWRDQSAARLLADEPADLQKAFDGAGLIYFSGITLAILSPDARRNLFEALDVARTGGAKTAFDPNLRPALWPDEKAMAAGIAEAASHADIALPTFDDDRVLFGDADPVACANRYRGYGVDEVVVKNGAENALIAAGYEEVVVAAQHVDNVIDATGAGDSFGGAYLAARLGGATLAQAAARAHATAAMVIQHQGALVPMDKIGAGST